MEGNETQELGLNEQLERHGRIGQIIMPQSRVRRKANIHFFKMYFIGFKASLSLDAVYCASFIDDI